MSLYCTHLIDNNIQSSTIKSYISGIKTKLKADGYHWDDQKVWFAALTRACKLKNDIVYDRFPIKKTLLENILMEVQRYNFDVIDCINQYNRLMYTSAFSTAYYGLMRVGEYTSSMHVLKARDVHLADDNLKYMLILHTSKTHGLNN